MNCDELSLLIPDIVDGNLSDALMAEVEVTLPQCPECQREIEIVRQVRAVLQAMQAENAHLTIPRGFEARLLTRIHQQRSGLELLDLSSKAFGEWLVELINLIGGLIEPREMGRPRTDRA